MKSYKIKPGLFVRPEGFDAGEGMDGEGLGGRGAAAKIKGLDSFLSPLIFGIVIYSVL